MIVNDPFVASFITKGKSQYHVANYNGWEYGYRTAEDFHFYTLQSQKSTGWYVSITSSGKHDTELTNRILETMKFAQQNGTVSSKNDNWQRYTDSTFHYSIQYPKQIYSQIKCPANEMNKFMLVIDPQNKEVINAPTCSRDSMYYFELTPEAKTIDQIYTGNDEYTESKIVIVPGKSMY